MAIQNPYSLGKSLMNAKYFVRDGNLFVDASELIEHYKNRVVDQRLETTIEFGPKIFRRYKI